MHFYFSKRGIQHKVSNEENQDRVLYGELGSVACIALADGAGSAIHGAKGAELACRVSVIKFLSEFETLYENYTSWEIRCQIAGEVISRLRYEARRAYGSPDSLTEFGSTLLVLCVDRVDGRYICIHLGDGIVIRSDLEDFSIISSPKNGITRDYTDLTSSKYCVSSMRLYRGKRPGNKFFLMSDGCISGLMENESRLNESIKQMLMGNNYSKLEEYLKRKSPEDDYSFICLDQELF